MSQHPGNFPQPGQGMPPQPSGNYGPDPYGQAQGGPQGPQFPSQPSGPAPQGPHMQHPGGMPPQGYPQNAAPAKKKSKAPVIAASVLGVAGLGVGGFFLANYFLGGGSVSAASSAIPKDVVAAVELNLNPGASNLVALRDIAKKFPGLDVPETNDYKELVYGLIPDGDMPDYESEIKPWLGDAITVAMTGPDADNIAPIIAMATTDTAKAEEFAKKHLAEGDYLIQNGTLVLHKGSLDANYLKDGALTDNPEYKSDMKAVKSDSLAVVWFGTSAAEKLTQGQLQALPTGVNYAKSHGTVSLRVATNTLELVANTTADQEMSSGKKVKEIVDALPNSSSIALGFSLPKEFAEVFFAAADNATGEMLGRFGIKNAEELSALVGDRIAISFNPATGAFLFRVDTPDMAKHEEIARTLIQNLSQLMSGVEIKAIKQGESAVYSFNIDPALAFSDGLGKAERYQKAVSGDGQGVAYIDVEMLLSTPTVTQVMSGFEEFLRPIEAIGMHNSTSGQTSEGMLRVTFR